MLDGSKALPDWATFLGEAGGGAGVEGGVTFSLGAAALALALGSGFTVAGAAAAPGLGWAGGALAALALRGRALSEVMVLVRRRSVLRAAEDTAVIHDCISLASSV